MLGDISKAEHIYIACGYTDMRKSIDGLAAIVQQNFKLDPFSNSLFLFCGRSSTKMKVLYWEGDGFVLLYKRLENGKFIWPRNKDEVMKITAQLALSQMKVNKKRTIAGIFAIALATSLITTVMCFVTSANKMLTDFLGSDYGEYGGAYSLMLAIPALLLGLLIAAMSITVISNIFSASANKRIQEFGILKCVGATGR